MDEVKAANYELAYEDYQNGMKYKDIAVKYGVGLNTVKSWKTRHWNKKGVHTKDEKVCTQKEKVATSKSKKKAIVEEVKQVVENPDLTDKQRLFCLHYIRCFNATKAYQKAYESSYETAASAGYRMLENVGVKEEIKRLKQNRLNREMLDESDIFQKYMDIAYADINDYVRVSASGITARSEFDGTLVSEIAETATGGIKIKLNDRMKALQWISDHMELATDEQKARIALIKAQTDKINAEASNEEEEDVIIVNDAPKETS